MGAGGAAASGSDAGFENTKKSKVSTLTKVKIAASKFKPPIVAILEGVGEAAKKSNLKRRKAFIKKQGLTGDDINMSDDYLSSKEGLAELKKQGYTTASDNVNTGGGNDNNNQPAEPVIVKKNIGGTEVQTTQAKLDEEKEDSQYDVRKVKKKGRTENILTSSKGVTKVSSDYSLGKKSLLGMV